ncbi:MAG: type II toxin-antitoxin system ParD family antitoxin [Planctomycetota bacterium]
MSTMNISLPESLRQFVLARVAERYGSASEYIRELVREDERRARLEKNEQDLLRTLKNVRFDRSKVKEAIEGLRKLRRELASRGVRMTKEEIRRAIDEARR